MKRRLLILMLTCLPLAAMGREEVLLSRYISQLAKEHSIEVTGLPIVGNDRLLPEARFVSVDKSLARALHRYNYIVNYGDSKVVRLIILGKRGTSVGELPAEYVEPVASEESSP